MAFMLEEQLSNLHAHLINSDLIVESSHQKFRNYSNQRAMYIMEYITEYPFESSCIFKGVRAPLLLKYPQTQRSGITIKHKVYWPSLSADGDTAKCVCVCVCAIVFCEGCPCKATLPVLYG